MVSKEFAVVPLRVLVAWARSVVSEVDRKGLKDLRGVEVAGFGDDYV